MLTAINGILIVVLLFAYGVATGDRLSMQLAIAAAGLSWVVNVLVEQGQPTPAVVGMVATAGIVVFAMLRIVRI